MLFALHFTETGELETPSGYRAIPPLKMVYVAFTLYMHASDDAGAAKVARDLFPTMNVEIERLGFWKRVDLVTAP